MPSRSTARLAGWAILVQICIAIRVEISSGDDGEYHAETLPGLPSALQGHVLIPGRGTSRCRGNTPAFGNQRVPSQRAKGRARRHCRTNRFLPHVLSESDGWPHNRRPVWPSHPLQSRYLDVPGSGFVSTTAGR